MKHFLTITHPKTRNGKVHAYDQTTLKDSITGKVYASICKNSSKNSRLVGLWLADNFQSQLKADNILYRNGVNKIGNDQIFIDSNCDWSCMMKIANAIGVSLVLCQSSVGHDVEIIEVVGLLDDLS